MEPACGAHGGTEVCPSPKAARHDQGRLVGPTEEVFKEVFKDSAVKRTGLAGLTRNIAFLQSGEAGHKKAPPASGEA